MSTYKDIDDFLAQDCPGKFKDKTRFLGLVGSVIYTVTGEELKGGFRYFECEPEDLVAAFENMDLKAMLDLEYAEDEDGDPDTSSLLITLHYTDSGSVLAMQVQQYQNYQPVPITPVVFLEGPAAKAHIELVKELDQST